METFKFSATFGLLIYFPCSVCPYRIYRNILSFRQGVEAQITWEYLFGRMIYPKEYSTYSCLEDAVFTSGKSSTDCRRCRSEVSAAGGEITGNGFTYTQMSGGRERKDSEMGCPEDIEGGEGIRERDGMAGRGVSVRNAVNERRIKHKTGLSGGGGWRLSARGERLRKKRGRTLSLSLSLPLYLFLYFHLFSLLSFSLFAARRLLHRFVLCTCPAMCFLWSLASALGFRVGRWVWPCSRRRRRCRRGGVQVTATHKSVKYH